MIKESLSILFDIIKKMFVYRGRSNNKEYLVFTVFEFLIFTPLLIIEKKYGRTDLLNIVVILCVTIYLFSHCALTIRRLHDCNLKGWWYLLNFIFSPFVFILLCFIKGNKGENRYGKEPTTNKETS